MLPMMINNRNWMPTMFDEFFGKNWMYRVNDTTPAINVKEDAKGYTMEVAAPGIRKEFCRVHVTNDGNLQIAIENKMEHKQEEKEEGHKERYLRREFYYSNYQQTYRLPEDVNADNISAQVSDGILSIALPKRDKEAEEKAHRAIEIK